jgi:hypothetical protein
MTTTTASTATPEPEPRPCGCTAERLCLQHAQVAFAAPGSAGCWPRPQAAGVAMTDAAPAAGGEADGGR